MDRRLAAALLRTPRGDLGAAVAGGGAPAPATDRQGRIRAGCCAASTANITSSLASTSPERSAVPGRLPVTICAVAQQLAPAEIRPPRSATSAARRPRPVRCDGADVDPPVPRAEARDNAGAYTVCSRVPNWVRTRG